MKARAKHTLTINNYGERCNTYIEVAFNTEWDVLNRGVRDRIRLKRDYTVIEVDFKTYTDYFTEIKEAEHESIN